MTHYGEKRQRKRERLRGLAEKAAHQTNTGAWLDKADQPPSKASGPNGAYTYREDVARNRLVFTFPEKPGAAIRALLERHGFAVKRNAYVRPLTAAALHSATTLRAQLDQLIVGHADQGASHEH